MSKCKVCFRHYDYKSGTDVGYSSDICSPYCDGLQAGRRATDKTHLVGDFSYQWINQDEIKVTKDYGGMVHEAVFCGGDFETLLSCLFIGAKTSMVWPNG